MTRDDFVAAYFLGLYRSEQKAGIKFIDVPPWGNKFTELELEEAWEQYNFLLEHHDKIHQIQGRILADKKERELLKRQEDGENDVV